MKRYLFCVSIIICFLFFTTGCKKYLDQKADKRFVVATTLQDAQSLLDNFTQMNRLGTLSEGATMDDNYFITDVYYDKINPFQKKEYIRDPGAIGDDYTWVGCYLSIANANVALETLNRLSDVSDKQAYNLAKGSALFFRAFFHHQVALIFALQYEKSKAASTLGIPYRYTSDINERIFRPSLQDNYDAIIQDLKNAVLLLPNKSNPVSRPSKAAAYGMLARVYLSMSDYDNSLRFADSALSINNTLIDYNTIPTPSATASLTAFGQFNAEDIFHATGQGYSLFSTTNWMCDSVLYNTYANNDLRKTLFFVTSKNQPNMYAFRGAYEVSTSYPHAGIIVDELYLMKAECLARLGNFASAMDVLNSLLVTRWKKNTYVNMTATDKDDALKQILVERRKELLMRNNNRWMDIKRLNLDPNYAITLTRKVKGVTYTLPPNDLRYALLIPITVIQNSGLEQNKR